MLFEVPLNEMEGKISQLDTILCVSRNDHVSVKCDDVVKELMMHKESR